MQPAPSFAPLVVRYDGAPPPTHWQLDETSVPESTLHNDVELERLRAELEALRGKRR